MARSHPDMTWLPVIGLDRHTPMIGLCIQADPEASDRSATQLVPSAQRTFYRQFRLTSPLGQQQLEGADAGYAVRQTTGTKSGSMHLTEREVLHDGPKNRADAGSKPIASAPQKVTRSVRRRPAAPPAGRRGRPAGRARRATCRTPRPSGRRRHRHQRSGIAAPTVKVAAEISAACTGRAVKVSEMPSSSRAWAPGRRWRSAVGDLMRQFRLQAAADVDCVSSSRSERARLEFLLFPRQVGVLGIGLGTDRDIFAGGHRHRARHQARRCRSTSCSPGVGGRRHADHQARGRDDAVVGAQDRGAQPPNSRNVVDLRMRMKSAHGVLMGCSHGTHGGAHDGGREFRHRRTSSRPRRPFTEIVSAAPNSVSPAAFTVQIGNDFAARGSATQARREIHSVANDREVHAVGRHTVPEITSPV